MLRVVLLFVAVAVPEHAHVIVVQRGGGRRGALPHQRGGGGRQGLAMSSAHRRLPDAGAPAPSAAAARAEHERQPIGSLSSSAAASSTAATSWDRISRALGMSQQANTSAAPASSYPLQYNNGGGYFGASSAMTEAVRRGYWPGSQVVQQVQQEHLPPIAPSASACAAAPSPLTVLRNDRKAAEAVGLQLGPVPPSARGALSPLTVLRRHDAMKGTTAAAGAGAGRAASSASASAAPDPPPQQTSWAAAMLMNRTQTHPLQFAPRASAPGAAGQEDPHGVMDYILKGAPVSDGEENDLSGELRDILAPLPKTRASEGASTSPAPEDADAKTPPRHGGRRTSRSQHTDHVIEGDRTVLATRLSALNVRGDEDEDMKATDAGTRVDDAAVKVDDTEADRRWKKREREAAERQLARLQTEARKAARIGNDTSRNRHGEPIYSSSTEEDQDSSEELLRLHHLEHSGKTHQKELHDAYRSIALSGGNGGREVLRRQGLPDVPMESEMETTRRAFVAPDAVGPEQSSKPKVFAPTRGENRVATLFWLEGIVRKLMEHDLVLSPVGHKLRRRTLHLAAHILDRYVVATVVQPRSAVPSGGGGKSSSSLLAGPWQSRFFDRNLLRKVGIATLLIARKYEQNRVVEAFGSFAKNERSYAYFGSNDFKFRLPREQVAEALAKLPTDGVEKEPHQLPAHQKADRPYPFFKAERLEHSLQEYEARKRRRTRFDTSTPPCQDGGEQGVILEFCDPAALAVLAQGEYTPAEIKEAELRVLHKIDFALEVALPLDFLEAHLRQQGSVKDPATGRRAADSPDFRQQAARARMFLDMMVLQNWSWTLPGVSGSEVAQLALDAAAPAAAALGLDNGETFLLAVAQKLRQANATSQPGAEEVVLEHMLVHDWVPKMRQFSKLAHFLENRNNEAEKALSRDEEMLLATARLFEGRHHI